MQDLATRLGSTGSVEGRVTTSDGEPVAAATVTLVPLETQDQGIETVTDAAGRFRWVDLAPGQYSVSAGRAELGDQIFRVLVHPAGSVDVRFVLEAGRSAAPWLRALRDDQTAAAAFAAGVRANREGNYDDAIALFESVLQVTPTCVDCHFNIGVSLSRLNRYADAEAAYRQALDIRPDYAPAHYGLADVFTRQDRSEEAAAARSEANRIAVRRLATGRARARETLGRGIETWDSGNVGGRAAAVPRGVRDRPRAGRPPLLAGARLRGERRPGASPAIVRPVPGCRPQRRARGRGAGAAGRFAPLGS